MMQDKLFSLRNRMFWLISPSILLFGLGCLVLGGMGLLARRSGRARNAPDSPMVANQGKDEPLQRQIDELTILHAVATAGAEATDEDTLIERAT